MFLAESRYYEVTVYTSDVMNAGTNSRVFVDLYGSNGVNSGPLALLKPDGDCFSRKSIDAFVIQVDLCMQNRY